MLDLAYFFFFFFFLAFERILSEKPMKFRLFFRRNYDFFPTQLLLFFPSQLLLFPDAIMTFFPTQLWLFIPRNSDFFPTQFWLLFLAILTFISRNSDFLFLAIQTFHRNSDLSWQSSQKNPRNEDALSSTLYLGVRWDGCAIVWFVPDPVNQRQVRPRLSTLVTRPHASNRQSRDVCVSNHASGSSTPCQKRQFRISQLTNHLIKLKALCVIGVLWSGLIKPWH